MVTNRYFNKFQEQHEQLLYENLLIEFIKIHGMDVRYIPRERIKHDYLYQEDALAQFKSEKCIEMYLEDYMGFQGRNDFMSKFGLQIEDQISWIVSRQRFEDEFPDLKTTEAGLARPREGDLIYFPLKNICYEIKFVEQEYVFYSFGKLFTYKLDCESWIYSHEKIQTEMEEINKIQHENAYTLVLNLGANNYVDFVIGETVFQGNSLSNATATGQVSLFDRETSVIWLNDITGNFVSNANISAYGSGAKYNVSTVNYLSMPTQNNAFNVEINDEADDYLNFNENDPFSEGNY
jgi:hypothetical protein